MSHEETDILSRPYVVETHHRNILEAIQAGKYEFISDIWAKLFGAQHEEITVNENIVLLHPQQAYHGKAGVEKIMAEYKLRSATFIELCALGELYPSVQAEFKITITETPDMCVDGFGKQLFPLLDTVVYHKGSKWFPRIYSEPPKRALRCGYEDSWCWFDRFATVRES